MAYKVSKGKNKIRGEQTFVDNITGSVISASAYYGVSYTGQTISGSTLLSTNVTGAYAQLLNLSGTIAQYTVITGSIVSGTTGLFTNLTSSIISASAIYATTYLNLSSSINTGSLLLTASVEDSTLTFTKGDGSTFNTTINNVSNAETASYVLNAVSSSFASTAATASILSGFNQNDYLLTSSFNLFTASYNTGSFSGSFTGSLLGTASFASNATTASYYDTSSLLVTSSVLNDTITFTKGNGTTYSLIVNNIATSSYASNADLLDGRDSTSFAGLTSNTFIGNQVITGNVDITGIVTANELHITYTTSSVIYTSGSTKFGDSIDDTHQFTGSILAGIVSGTNATFNTFTGSLFGTASFSLNAQTASYYNTSNLLTTASVSNATITFTKGDANTFPITINNVSNAETASYVLNAVSSSYASYANNANALDGYNSTDFAILNTNNTFTADQTYIQSALTFSNGYVFPTVLDKPSLVLAAINSRYFHYIYTRHKNASPIDNAIDFYTSDGTQFGTFPTNAVHGMTVTNGKVGIKTTSPNYELEVNGNANITGSVIVTGSIITNTGFTGSLFGTASYATLAQSSLTASYIQTAVSATYAANADLLDGRDSTTFAGTGSNTFNGNQIITGSITSTSTISGNIGLFTTMTSSQSLVSNVMSVGTYAQFLPVVSASLPVNQTASYIYTSGSTNDLYFTQYQPGTSFTNTTRLRWMEGGLSTGLLHGGVLSTVTGTTTFNLSSGSGIVVNFNASTGSDPYPTIKYVQWNNFISQSLIYSASSPITYIAVDENGAISQTNVAFTIEQFKDRIVIGRVLHQTGSVTNGTTATTTTAYGINSNTQDFFRAFGPLKVNGHVLAASGSTLGITRTAGDSYVEGRNYTTNPNIPNYVSSTDDTAQTTTKIFYQWVSGSSFSVDTNGGVGYSAIRPAFYNNNGTVTAISPTNNKFTVQRVYWFPKSVTRAFYVYYGSTIYTSLSDAIAAINDEPNFIEGDNTKGTAIYLGAIALEANTSDLTITTKAKIVNGGLFRGSGAGSAGGGGGGGTTSPGGSNHEIQYNDAGTFNGSANLTFDTTTLTLNGNFTMTGTGSINIDGGYITGSLAQFTTISGSTVTGSTALFTTITGSLFGTASYATTAGTVVNGVYTNANNTFTGINTFNTYYITGSITGSDAKFTSVSGAHAGSGAGLTSIPNGALVNSSVTVGTTGISLGSSATTIQGISVLTGSTVTGSTALFTTITGSTVTGSTGLFANTTVGGTSIIGTALYTSKTTTTVVGNNAIYNVATASYDGMFVDYTARSGSNARAGQIMAIWSGTSVNYTETTTNDFGSTTGLAMAVVINGTNMQLSASASTANWTVKTIIRTI